MKGRLQQFIFVDGHAAFDEFVHSLGFDQISARIASEKGVDTGTIERCAGYAF